MSDKQTPSSFQTKAGSKPNKTSDKQTHSFQTEVSQLLDLMVHSLYSNKEIFLRELISNASDAIDRLRFEALADKKLKGLVSGEIKIDINEKNKTVTISDDGIGMTQDEVITNIGTIANSGTKKFLQNLDKDKAADSNLIGQFGVGFYSSFIVANEVVIETLKAGEDKKTATRWQSKGEGQYSIETITKDNYGTTVTLYIKAAEKEFLNSFTLKNIIHKYSEHITVPIKMLKPAETVTDDKTKKAKTKAKAVIEYETINKAKAFWTEDKKSLKTKDYNEFYQQLSYDFEPPLAYLHNKVEGKLEYTSLFYIPSKAPFDLWEPKPKGSIKLYAKRVFIMDDNDKLMPLYLRFIKGVIDTADLPLNVSREILQSNKVIDKIRSASVKRILNALTKMQKNKPEDYAKFWKQFGMVIKEGVVEDFTNKDIIADLLLFATSESGAEQQTVALVDYVSRMRKGQKYIYYITSENFAAAKNSPHLEIFNKKGIEVLLLSDRVDEWLVNNFREYQGKTLKSIAKGDLADLDSKSDKKLQQKKEKDFGDIIKQAQEVLKDKVKSVRISHRLDESPSCLVADETDMGANMERIMKSLGQAVPETKPILELNPDHALVKRLESKMDNDLLEVLFDQAVLAEGGQLPNPAAFVKKMNTLLLA